jgi:hypothetical protein
MWSKPYNNGLPQTIDCILWIAGNPSGYPWYCRRWLNKSKEPACEKEGMTHSALGRRYFLLAAEDFEV